MARIMAFDFGLKRVGIAVTDPLQIIATALDTVPTSTVYDYIRSYLQKEEVSTFVVGFPYNTGYEENEVAAHIHAFIKKLNKFYPQIPLVKVDETFTSKMAAQTMIMSGAKKKDRRNKANLDKISAAIILQTYMEMQQ